jgi:hypothetical protein
MSFGDNRRQRDRRGLGAALGSQELCAKSPPLLAVFGPVGAGETVRIGRNGGGLETEIQRSPFSAQSSCRHALLLPTKASARVRPGSDALVKPAGGLRSMPTGVANTRGREAQGQETSRCRAARRPPRPPPTLSPSDISGVMTFCSRGPTSAARMVSAALSLVSSQASGVKKAECGVMIRRPSHHGSRAQ